MSHSILKWALSLACQLRHVFSIFARITGSRDVSFPFIFPFRFKQFFDFRKICPGRILIIVNLIFPTIFCTLKGFNTKKPDQKTQEKTNNQIQLQGPSERGLGERQDRKTSRSLARQAAQWEHPETRWHGERLALISGGTPGSSGGGGGGERAMSSVQAWHCDCSSA